jgi:beta-lactamase class A
VIARRDLLTGSALLAAAPGLPAAGQEAADPLRRGLAELDRRHGGRLGVAILDTGSGRRIAHRGEERFALCSTFKVLAAALVLARVDRGEESLGRRIRFAREDLVTYSPVTERHAGEAGGMTMGEICEAAVTLSDNTAGNLMLDSFGGPEGLTAYMRSLGDTVTRLDRRETALNEASPGDPRDTTTPEAMVEALRKIVLGTALSPASREVLAGWMLASRTGGKRLRAGVPQGWRVGDKTGTGANNVANDVAVLWPPEGRAPVLVAAYYAESRASETERNAVLAEVGRLAAAI